MEGQSGRHLAQRWQPSRWSFRTSRVSSMKDKPVHRRAMMSQTVAGAIALAAAPARATAKSKRAAGPNSLDAAARQSGRRFGSAFAYGGSDDDRGSFANPAYASLLERECSILVPENEMKWQALRPAADSFDFTRFDAMVAYAVEKGFALRGHTLLWHQSKWMPAWERTHDFGSRPATGANLLLTQHIQTICQRYDTAIASYDVVNEAVRPKDGELYETALSKALGGAQAALDTAFHTARSSARHATLVYNDYMSWEPGNAAHRKGVLKLLEGFRVRDVPVDALGIQSHLVTQPSSDRARFASLEKEWRNFINAVVDMGYRLVVTELDVRDNHLPSDILIRDRAVADFTRAYMDLMLDYPQLDDILTWGMSDRYSWIEGFEPRVDRVARRPCPYDDRFKAKPMRDALFQSLTEAASASRRT